MLKRTITIMLSIVFCVSILSSCVKSSDSKKETKSQNAAISSDNFADMVREDSAVEGENYDISGKIAIISTLTDKPVIDMRGDYLIRFKMADSELEKMENIEKDFYSNQKDVNVVLSGSYKSNSTASDGNLNIFFENVIIKDIEGYEEPTYEDIMVGEILIPAELKATLYDKGSSSYSVEVAGNDSVHILVTEMSENEYYWSQDDMKNWVIMFKSVDNSGDYTISDTTVNNYVLFTYTDSSGTSYIACRDYGTNKYSFVFREKWDETACKDFLSKLKNK